MLKNIKIDDEFFDQKLLSLISYVKPYLAVAQLKRMIIVLKICFLLNMSKVLRLVSVIWFDSSSIWFKIFLMVTLFFMDKFLLLFHLAMFINISSACSFLPWLINHLGDSGKTKKQGIPTINYLITLFGDIC